MDLMGGSIENFNKNIVESTERFSQYPQEFSSGLYNIAIAINEALMPIAIALLMTYFIFSFYEKAVNFKLQDYKIYGSSVITLAVSVVILVNSVAILNVFYLIGNNILNTIMSVTTDTPISIDADAINDVWEDVGFWGTPGAFFEMLFSKIILSLILFIANFIINFVVLSRMFEIYIYIAFAPIAMCTFPNDSTRNICKGYLTNFCAVVLKSSVVILVLQLYKVYLTDQVGSVSSSGAEYFWATLTAGLMIITLVIGAEKISQKVVGSLK